MQDLVTKELDKLIDDIYKHLKDEEVKKATLQTDAVELAFLIYKTTCKITDGTVGVITMRVNAASTVLTMLTNIIQKMPDENKRLVE